ncbi:MAG: substrate-binding domain-containing protein [Flavobacteriales bacterium]
MKTDTLTSGTIQISVDESFRPVIQEQIKVFTSQNPQAQIIVHYKPETECLKDLMCDSIRMVIVARGLSPEEEDIMKAQLFYVPRYNKLAYDAIAVILHSQAREDVFSMAALRNILEGIDDSGFQAVMDGTRATGTVRYLIDMVLQGKQLAENVVGAKDSRAVIDYVASHPKAIGFIGVSWIGDQDDPEQLVFLKRVKVAALECGSCDEKTYVKPYQANIALKNYPLIRLLYYIVKENYGGLGSGFSNFMRYEKGQLIFRRAYLMPAQMSFQVRKAELRES